MLCYFLILSLFSNNHSIGYTKKLALENQKRLEICSVVYAQALKHEVSPILAITIAFHESKFTNVTASDGKGFGAMQATPHLWCDTKKKEDCDLIEAGIKALKTYLEIHDYNELKAVEAYAGKGAKARAYAKRIINQKTKATIIMESLDHENLFIFKSE